MISCLDYISPNRHIFASIVVHQWLLGPERPNLRVQIGIISPFGKLRVILLVKPVEEYRLEVERMDIETPPAIQILDQCFLDCGGVGRQKQRQ